MIVLRVVAVFLMLSPVVCSAGDVEVDGYYRRNGTYVAPHTRSAPNAYRWDNKSYTPSQPAYNDSYYQPKRNNPGWYQPSDTRFQDSNPYNNYGPAPVYNPGVRSLPELPSLDMPRMPSLYDND